MTRTRLTFSAISISLVLFLALAAILDTSIKEVDAGHDNRHTSPYLWWAGAIANNVSLGESIKVCSPHYPNATEEAIGLWSTATANYTTASLFAYDPSSDNCDISEIDPLPQDRLINIIVNHGGYCGNIDVSLIIGCLAHDGTTALPNSESKTFIGQTELRLLAYPPTADEPTSPKYNDLVRDIGHELGHALGLAHYHCGYSDQKDRSGPLQLDRPAIMSFDTNRDSDTADHCIVNETAAQPARLTDVDIADFMAAYYGTPAPPSDLSAASGDGSINLSWAEATDDPAIDGYEYKLGDADWLPIDPSDASTTGFPLDDLTNGTTYSVQIRAVRGYIESEPATVTAAPTALVVPVITDFSFSGTQPSSTFTWSGSSPRELRWELHRAATQQGAYNRVGSPTTDSVSPITFSSQSRGYWYKMRGQACEDRTDGGFTVTVCGDWSDFSSPVKLPSISTGPGPGPGPVDPTTCDADTRPGNVAVITAMTTRQETQWRAAQLPVIGCIEYEERRTVTTYTLFTVTYTCVDGGWFGTMTWHTSTIEGPWTATGNSRSCNLARSATAGRYSLPTGDHELRWDGQRIAFTVPAGATVELQWRQQDGGAYVAVLSTKQGVELVLGADALSGGDQARSIRFAGATDPTLSAIAASLRDPAAEAPESSVTAPTECPVAEPSDDGVTNVDLDTAPCAIVRGGGAVTVALDGESLAITLAAERDWGTMNLTGADETAAVMFFDFLTGGSITLALTDGSELARHIPEGNTDLPALFDAMIPAAPANDGS